MIRIQRTLGDEALPAFTLLVGQTYTVGRKGCDLSFTNDSSISRRHADIRVEHSLANMCDPLLTPTLVVTDVGSKFGTYVNTGIDEKIKMSLREPLNLSEGDRVKFGMQWNEFRVEYSPLVVTPSQVRNESVCGLKQALLSLGGHYVTDYLPSCSYVVMDELYLTVKAVCALLSGKYIVSPDFFADMLECVKMQKPMPNPNKYLPPIKEKNIMDAERFEPSSVRGELFSGKTFVFVGDKHLKKMKPVVVAGGGQWKLLSNVRNLKDLGRDNVILMKPPDSDMFVADSAVRKALDMYASNGKKRMIHDSELGLAAVYISVDQHCNPYYVLRGGESEARKLETQSQRADKDDVLVDSTQDADTQPSFIGGTQVVEETFVGAGQKRDLLCGGSSRDQPPFKKRVTEVSPIKKSNTQQSALSRLFGGDDSDEEEEEEERDIIPSSPVRDDKNDRSVRTNFVAGSPPPPKTSTSPVFKSPNKIPNRNSFEIMESPQASTSRSTRSKRRLTLEKSLVEIEVIEDEEEMEQPAQKRQRTQPNQISVGANATCNEKLIVDAVKLNIKPEIIEVQPDIPGAATVSEIYLPVGPPSRIKPQTVVRGGKPIKNYKRFQKSLPLCMINNQNMTISSSSSASSRRNKKNTPASSGTSTTQTLNFEVFDCAPSLPPRSEREPSPIRNEDPQNMELDMQENISEIRIEEHKKKSTNRNRQEPEEEKPPSPTHLRRSGRRGLSKLIQLDDEDNDDFAF